jgi:hypothetical protein
MRHHSFASELSDELWTTVGNVLLGGSVVPPNVPVVQLGSSDSIEAGVALVEVGLLTEDVNHKHDHIKPMHFQKLVMKSTETVSQCSSGISVR